MVSKKRLLFLALLFTALSTTLSDKDHQFGALLIKMADLTEKKIQQSIEDRKRTNRRFLENVKTFTPFLELEEKAFREGALSRKHKELMALSISIVTKCEPCMERHLDQALRNDATDEEVYEPIDVSIEMGGGQAGAYARFVLKAMDYFKSNSARDASDNRLHDDT